MTESRFPVTTLEFEISFLQGSFTVLVKLSFWWTVPPLLRFDVCLTSFLFLFCISFCYLYYILYVLFCQHFFIIIFIFFHYKILFYKLYEIFQSFYFIHRIVDKYPVCLHHRTQTDRALKHCQFLCYNRMYFKIKATASTYIRILIPFFFALPVSTFMIT